MSKTDWQLASCSRDLTRDSIVLENLFVALRPRHVGALCAVLDAIPYGPALATPMGPVEPSTSRSSTSESPEAPESESESSESASESESEPESEPESVRVRVDAVE